jgi:hypothetical protein
MDWVSIPEDIQATARVAPAICGLLFIQPRSAFGRPTSRRVRSRIPEEPGNHFVTILSPDSLLI